jgi:hypothetical protein
MYVQAGLAVVWRALQPHLLTQHTRLSVLFNHDTAMLQLHKQQSPSQQLERVVFVTDVTHL